MSKVFVSFGNRKFRIALNRLSKQINDSNYFDTKYFFNEVSLYRLPNFFQIIPIINKYNRGFGLWIWKIFLINYVLDQIKYNDIMVYADAGCYFEKKYINELDELIQKLKDDTYDNIGFQITLIEKQWTKMDTIIYLDGNFPNIINSGQLLGGIQIIKKTEETVELYRKAFKCALNTHLLDDSPSIIPNCTDFHEHRHDQSIMSILRKKHSKTLILPNYTESINWDECKFPIQARRLRN